ncbi:hypothetical protein F5B21DRAFT_458369 [Xylaria acuta]|nr:hypothetical protein F5B21DRAFT_458369 [Xylaria acuta]
MALNSTPKKRKSTPMSAPSRALPKKRRLISVANEVNDGITTPRGFTEILQLDDEDKEIATLQAEVSRLKGVQSDLSLQVNNLSTEKSKLLETIQQLQDRSNHQKGLEDELKCAQSENTQAKRTEEALQRELAAQRQTIQEHKAEIAETKTKLQQAQKQASLNEGHFQRLDEAKSELELRFLKANHTHVTMQKKNDKLTAELERTKKERAKIPALRSELMATEAQLSTTRRDAKEAEEQVSRLQSQLEEAGRRCASFQSQIAKLEHDNAAREEGNGRLVAAIAKTHGDIKVLQLSLDATRKALENTKLERKRAQDDLSELTNERAELCRRIESLEAKVRKYEKTGVLELMAKLVVEKQEVSRLSSVELDLQAAQQQIEEIDHHMGRCPFVQNPDFWDGCLKISGEVSKLLGESSGRSDQSPTESHSTSHHKPSPSFS